MKTRYLILAGALLLGLAGWAAGHRAWRARNQLVTLNVRNAPLAEVLRSVSRQTGKNIRAENALNAQITIQAQAKPLAWVLNRLAEQVGARWSTVYAVYQSKSALKELESTLIGNGNLESLGWKQVAPGPASNQNEPPELDPPGPGPGPEAAEAIPPAGKMMVFRRAPGGPMMMRGANGQTETWQPESVVLPANLATQIGTEPLVEPLDKAAELVARKVQGQWATYLVFKKSILGVGFAPPQAGEGGFGPPKHHESDRFANLTPEQRVARARQRLSPGPELELMDRRME